MMAKKSVCFGFWWNVRTELHILDLGGLAACWDDDVKLWVLAIREFKWLYRDLNMNEDEDWGDGKVKSLLQKKPSTCCKPSSSKRIQKRDRNCHICSKKIFNQQRRYFSCIRKPQKATERRNRNISSPVHIAHLWFRIYAASIKKPRRTVLLSNKVRFQTSSFSTLLVWIAITSSAIKWSY